MKKTFLVEISVEALETAIAAERGGADRIELCADAVVGGVTPDGALIASVRASLKIPIFSMIRPRGGDFVYSEDEFAAMRVSIRQARELRMDGVVLGLLTSQRKVDIARTQALVESAQGMEVTFHRAMDEVVDLPEALDDIVKTGASRILTSGGKSSALEGANAIADLVKRARGRIGILPGAGIHPDNVAEVARITNANEFHSGLSSVLGRTRDAKRFENEVRRLIENLRAAKETK